MSKIWLSLPAVACLLTIPTVAGAYPGQELADQAKISISEARDIALAAVPGTVADQELEQEPGGSGLRFSFDIQAHGVVYEVGVDAVTGTILENQPEGPNPD